MRSHGETSLMQTSSSFFIATSWNDRPVSQQFRALSNELVSRGHRVLLLIDKRNRSVEAHRETPAVYTWPSARPIHVGDARFLSGLIRQHRPDCLIASSGAVNIMTLVGWWHGVKQRIAWHHTLSAAIDADCRVPRWKLAMLRYRKRCVWQFATLIAAVSEAGRRDLQTQFGVRKSKCRVVYNSLVDPLAGKVVAKSLSGVNRLVCVGRFHRCKGQDVLLRALVRLRAELPRLSVEFIGEGPLRPECERLASDLGVAECCKFSGVAHHERVLAAMGEADLTVVPSRDEAFGLVALESMAMGTPAVASAVGGLPEILGEGLNSLLVPSDDPVALAERLKMVLDDVSGYDDLVRRARARFLEGFEQSAAVKRQADWLENMLGSPIS